MKPTFKAFKSIEQIKLKAEHIKKGQIIPTRILRSKKRKDQFKVKSGANSYAIPTTKGYLIFVENNDDDFECVIRINTPNGEFIGSPYTPNGDTTWVGNNNISDKELLNDFNKEYLKQNDSSL